jgi:hypothetical protein
MDIFDVLRSEHSRIKSLLIEIIEGGRGRKSSERLDAFNDLKRELVSHNRAEETVLYENLKTNSELRKHVLHRSHEHEMVESMLLDLETMDQMSPTWPQELILFSQHLNFHINEEEDDLFDRIRGEIPTGKLQQLARRFEMLKSQILRDLTRQVGMPSKVNPMGLDIQPPS